MARGGKHRGGARGGRGRGGGRGGATGAGRNGNTGAGGRVAYPSVSELPTSLIIASSGAGIPAPLVSAFSEFSHAQPFFSALERINPELGGSVNAYKTCWVGLSGETLSAVHRDDEDSFHARLELTDGSVKPVFVKRIHLLDPISAMEGEYVWPEEGALPAPSDLWKHALAKINDPMNEAYIDALFALIASRLVQSGISPHWCACYGTYTARVDKYLYNITDEYASMRVKPWWRRNQKLGLFTLHKDEDDAADDVAAESQFMTQGLSDMGEGDFEALDDDAPAASVATKTVAEADETEATFETADESHVKLTAPRLRLKRMSRSIDSRSSSDEDDSEDEIQQFVEFRNYPVQVTLLEHAEGTMDELLDDEDEEDSDMLETKEARWSAWLFQVIAALSVAQHYFGFVHNDLHTNNVMWSKTDKTHLYYRVHKGKGAGAATWTMKVPTYGRLMKIIDFGRASYHLPDPAGFFISDAFYPGNDAATQYNCEPFYDADEGKKVEPNPSFDLSRLSVSMIECLYPDRPEAAKPTKVMSREGGKLYSETVSGVYNTLWEWLVDDEGKNILRSPSGEERYPDFDLYRALAADVHRAVPSKQIERALFSAYRCSTVPSGETVYDLFI